MMYKVYFEDSDGCVHILSCSLVEIMSRRPDYFIIRLWFDGQYLDYEYLAYMDARKIFRDGLKSGIIDFEYYVLIPIGDS